MSKNTINESTKEALLSFARTLGKDDPRAESKARIAFQHIEKYWPNPKIASLTALSSHNSVLIEQKGKGHVSICVPRKWTMAQIESLCPRKCAVTFSVPINASHVRPCDTFDEMMEKKTIPYKQEPIQRVTIDCIRRAAGKRVSGQKSSAAKRRFVRPIDEPESNEIAFMSGHDPEQSFVYKTQK